jgi:hypothetical protein
MARVRLFGRLTAEGLSRIRQSWTPAPNSADAYLPEVAHVTNEMGAGIEGWSAPRYLTLICDAVSTRDHNGGLGTSVGSCGSTFFFARLRLA